MTFGPFRVRRASRTCREAMGFDDDVLAFLSAAICADSRSRRPSRIEITANTAG